MPEVDTPPPVQTPSPDTPDPTRPPQVPKPQSIDPARGNKYREALAARQKSAPGPNPTAESPPAEPPGPVPAEGKSPPPETAPAKEPEAQTPAPEKPSAKPSSALDVALGETQSTAAPAEPLKDELSEFEKIEAPKGDDWKRARELIKRQRDEISSIRNAPPKVDENFEAIRKENENLKGRLENLNTNLKAINAEYSEEFQSLVANRDKALGKIQSKMKYVGSEKSEDLVAALNMPDGRLKTVAVKEALSELDADDKIAVRTLIERLDEADEKIIDFRKDLPAQWDRLQAERGTQEREQFEQQMKGLETEFHKVVNDLPRDIVRMRSVPEDVSGAKEWNEPIRAAIDSALTAIKPNGGVDFQQTVRLAIKGGLYDRLWEDYVSQNKELREARQRLQEYDQATPDFKGQKKPSQEPAETPGQKYRRALAARQGVGPGP